jgi:alanine dehydrogenase
MFVRAGHEVRVQRGAGDGSGFDDDQYRLAGANFVDTPAESWAADLVLKVKEPVPAEFGFLRPDLTLFTYLHLAADRPLTEALLRAGTTAIAYETVQSGRRLPLLEPMSEIAGRMGSIVGAYYLSKAQGGKGVLLGGVPGVLPGMVLIIGGGTAGVNAGRVAAGMGADVTILEVDLEKMHFLDVSLHGRAHTLYSNEQNLMDMLPQVDLLIGAVLVPGARAPRLIRREMLRVMKPGAVFVDIAIDQGGCAETSRPTTHENPVYVEEDTIHYCVTNMPGAVGRTSTFALCNVTLPWALQIANHGLELAARELRPVAAAVNIYQNEITNRAVADSFGLPYTARFASP